MFKSDRTRLAAGLTVCVLLFACTHQEAPVHQARKTASLSDQPPPELGEQWDKDVNGAQVSEIISISKDMLEKRSKDDNFYRRDAHPKHHGCVMASFKVDSSALTSDLRVGIFAPEARTEYPAWIRFSNGDPDGGMKPDLPKDIRGMAIKLMNVPGATAGSQDFVMLTGKEFFSKNGADYLELHKALSNPVTTVWYILTHSTTRHILNASKIQSPNPLQVQYFSSVPYKLGPRSMKFKVYPCSTNEFHDEVPDGEPSRDYLRERLVSTLQSKNACFEFYVQPNMNPEQQPVEDPTIAWDESTSPYIKVATLTIPHQNSIDSPAHMNFCENLSFNPWHTRPETRPLGQINRMRLEIYPAISEFRHHFNNIPIIEPRSHEICVGETAPLCQTPRH